MASTDDIGSQMGIGRHQKLLLVVAPRGWIVYRFDRNPNVFPLGFQMLVELARSHNGGFGPPAVHRRGIARPDLERDAVRVGAAVDDRPLIRRAGEQPVDGRTGKQHERGDDQADSHTVDNTLFACARPLASYFCHLASQRGRKGSVESEGDVAPGPVIVNGLNTTALA